MRSLPLLLSTVAISGLFGSAFAQQSVEGTWNLSGGTMPKGVRANVSFRSGKTKFTLTGPQDGKTVVLTTTGDYSLKGDQLTVRFTDAAITSKDFTPAQRQAMNSPQMRANLRRGAAQQNSTGRVRFAGRDKFVLTEKSGKRTTFTRAR